MGGAKLKGRAGNWPFFSLLTLVSAPRCDKIRNTFLLPAQQSGQTKTLIMDKSKIIAVAVLLCIGGALLYTKAQDPAAPSNDDHDHDEGPQPTAVVKPATPATSNGAPVTGGATGESAATTGAATTGAATTGATETKPETDTKELKIIDERLGTGPVANTGDRLSMNYKGTLLNGNVFDQSYGRAPFDFSLGAGEVIEGWDKGIVGMKVGGKRKLVIPASMAYKDQDKGTIPPNSTLVFEVELLSVNGASS